MKQTTTFLDFFESEKAGGLILVFCAVLSLVLTNSPVGVRYAAFWTLPVAGEGLEHWVNDGLMAIFFLLIRLELKRELINASKTAIRIFSCVAGVIGYGWLRV